LRQVRSFLELHGNSRFEEAWPKDTRDGSAISDETELALRRTINRAGFRRLEAEGKGENWEYYVLPEAWRGEVCKGFDAAAIAKALIAKGWMRPGAGKHLTREVRVPGVGRIRLLCIASTFLGGGDG
jgi:putative DNA primase/helicase